MQSGANAGQFGETAMTIFRLSRRAVLGASAASALFAPHIARAQPVVLRWGDVTAPTHPSSQAALRAAAEVKQISDGRIEIQSFPGGQLGGTRDMIEAVATDALTMVTEGAAAIGQFVTQLSIVEAPYLWKDAAQLSRVLNSPVRDEFNKLLIEKRGMRIIAVNYYGKRHLTTGKKEVRTVADMKGFKLRVPEVDTFKAMAEAWGAKPTPMNLTELYLALSQGAVDGQENPLPTIQSSKFNEVQKFLVLTGHIITPRLVVVNEAAWQKIAAADRSIVTAAVVQSATWNDAEVLAQEASLLGTLQKAGMTVIEPDVESFRKPVLATLPAMFESKWGKGAWERIQAM